MLQMRGAERVEEGDMKDVAESGVCVCLGVVCVQVMFMVIRPWRNW